MTNYDSGNSGGPVFYVDKGKLKAIGIVSHTMTPNGIKSHQGGITPISNMK